MNKKLNQVLAVVLTIAALMTGQSVYAESTWTVTNENGTSNTFTIKRSETGYTQKVLYRTVSLSAYAGQHYTAKSGTLEFLANEDTKTITVSELTPNGSYKYQNGSTNRKYRFEVTDRGGFILASADRTMTNGTSFSADKVSQSITNLVYFNNSGNYTSAVNSSKYVDVAYTPPTSQVETSGTLQGYVLIDDEYDYAQKAATVSTSTLINSTGATATYLKNLNYKIYATVCFTEKEKDDGYQYIQIIAGNSGASYDTGSDPEGSVNNPVNSVYKTCFELSNNSNAEGKQYFPHRYNYANKSEETSASIGITEFSQTNGKLWQQKFKSGYQASTSGSLIFDANVENITTRFDAGGNNDDTWGYKDLFVRMAFVDASAPTKTTVSVNPGWHAKGNTVYVSVAFNEIVTVTGTPTLSTTSDNHWGSLSYVAGSGTNVLTFSTTIPQDATGDLNITGLSGTVKDLAGNSLTGSGVTASSLCTLDGDLVYTIGDFQYQDNSYLIACHDDLRGLAGYVNAGNNCSGLTFRQVADIAFTHTTNWNNANSTENNYTAIGPNNHPFQGTYDGDGHTISGIRIYKGGDNCQGLFGYVGSGGTVKRVTLADTRITGRSYTGGITGTASYCTIEDCTVGADVCIHAVQSSTYRHGGIVGGNQANYVRRCISRATLTVANGLTDCMNFGGIVGLHMAGTVTDCIAEGAVIPNVNGRGAIVGYKLSSGTLTRNFYRGCTVAGVENATGVGKGNSDSTTETSDVDGARALYAITLGTNVTINRTPATDPLPGTNNYTYANGADIAGVPYAIAGATLTLGYSGEVNTGYHVEYSATAGTISGTTLTMPSEAVTVSATLIVNSYTVHFDTNYDDNGITISGTMDDQVLTYDANQTLTANAFTRTGYTFAGWNTQADGQGTSYTNQQATPNITSEDNATVTLYAQWNVTNWTGSGSQESPYLIRYPSQLVMLATNSQSNQYSGKFFRLENDLDMSGVEMGPIGINSKNFKGTFDGNGHAIRNLTINKPDDDYVALFGYSWSGFVVRNLIIDGANITGKNKVGALVGYTGYSTVENCLVVNSSVTASTFVGIIAYDYGSNVTLNGNYYYNCSVTKGTNPTSTTNIGTNAGDKPGATRVHTLTLPEHVTLNGSKTVTYNAVTYCAPGADFTLSPAVSSAMLEDVLVDGNAATDLGNNTWSFQMPAADATVTATVKVPYIDADGNTQYCTDFTVIQTTNSNINLGSSGETNWYVISGDVSTKSITFKDATSNLILCDGGNLSVSVSASSEAIYSDNGSINIFAQSTGDGTINVLTACKNAIDAHYSIDINGGVITASNANYGISASNGNVTIRRGNIDVHANYYAIDARNNIYISGGVIHASCPSYEGRYGMYSLNGTITLGCSSACDRIYADNYKAYHVKIAVGQTLTDGYSDHSYSGTLTSEQIAAIAGKTLMKPLGPVSYIDENGQAQTCTEYTILSDGTIPIDGYDWGSIGTNDQDTWYVATGNYSFSNHYGLEAYGHVHLILCDGATLTMSGQYYGISARSLTIYGQSEGTGSLLANTTAANSAQGAINFFGALTINGGNVSTSSVSGDGIVDDGNNCTLTINGGNVNATGANDGIHYYGAITLGWTRATDRIYASSYVGPGTISIKSGQILTDDTNNLYSGTLSSEQIAAIAGKTLQPYGITVAANQNGDDYWTTYYNSSLNFSTDVTIYKAAKNGTSSVTLTEVTGGIISAGQAVILKSTASPIELTLTTTAATGDYTGNELQGVDVATAQEDGKTYYVLSKPAGKELGFYKLSNTVSLGAHKAYLEIASVNNAPAFFGFGGSGENTTAINEPESHKSNEFSGDYYTLDGRKLQGKPTQKGIYVRNGRKIIIK